MLELRLLSLSQLSVRSMAVGEAGAINVTDQPCYLKSIHKKY